jgi:hypothetical protein
MRARTPILAQSAWIIWAISWPLGLVGREIGRAQRSISKPFASPAWASRALARAGSNSLRRVVL